MRFKRIFGSWYMSVSLSVSDKDTADNFYIIVDAITSQIIGICWLICAGISLIGIQTWFKCR